MEFKDCFSSVASGYAAYRPSYPEELFSWLAGVAPGRGLAWDCACGSGQATVGLARHFAKVTATDASEAQVMSAPRDPANIEWRVAVAHESGLEDGSADVVTVAQALHWFELDRFYKEVQRVARPGGVLAVWTYGMNQVEGDRLNDLVGNFYENVVGPYWPPERRLVESGYRSLPFPFAEMPVPDFRMEAHWTLPQLLGYFRTWSATNRFIAEQGRDPVERLEDQLRPEWGDPERPRLITWPLSLRAGRRA